MADSRRKDESRARAPRSSKCRGDCPPRRPTANWRAGVPRHETGKALEQHGLAANAEAHEAKRLDRSRVSKLVPGLGGGNDELPPRSYRGFAGSHHRYAGRARLFAV